MYYCYFTLDRPLSKYETFVPIRDPGCISLHPGAIAGIIVGGLVFLGILIGLLVWASRRRAAKHSANMY
jgi:hypothetical protein